MVVDPRTDRLWEHGGGPRRGGPAAPRDEGSAPGLGGDRRGHAGTSPGPDARRRVLPARRLGHLARHASARRPEGRTPEGAARGWLRVGGEPPTGDAGPRGD